MEQWNGIERIFFSLFMFACLHTNYCQEYIMLIGVYNSCISKYIIVLGGLPRNLYSYQCCYSCRVPAIPFASSSGMAAGNW